MQGIPFLGSDGRACPATTAPIVGADGESLQGSVAELVTVEIGGHDQSITIRGSSDGNPVILYLAGGPGGTDLGAIRRDVGIEGTSSWQPGTGAGHRANFDRPAEFVTVMHEATAALAE